MKGLDIYSGDNIESFKAIKDSGVEVVYIKATEGRTYTDSTLQTYYEQAKAVGLKVGFYHFLRANNPVDEAQHFLAAIDGLEADCKYAIDVEVDLGQSADEISWNVRQFANYLIAKGKEPCIYTYTSFYKDYLNDSVKDLPLWIAEYGVSEPHIGTSYVGFQYTETGTISGVNGNVDVNTFNEGILLSGGKKKVKNIVIYNRGTDEHSAEVLADFLNCPTLANDRKFDFTCVENIYGVGGKKEQYTSYLTKLISGEDRYATNQAVLNFIKNQGK